MFHFLKCYYEIFYKNIKTQFPVDIIYGIGASKAHKDNIVLPFLTRQIESLLTYLAALKTFLHDYNSFKLTTLSTYPIELFFAFVREINNHDQGLDSS